MKTSNFLIQNIYLDCNLDPTYQTWVLVYTLNMYCSVVIICYTFKWVNKAQVHPSPRQARNNNYFPMTFNPRSSQTKIIFVAS